MERLTEYHAGKVVIKDKNLLPQAMEKLAKFEDLEEQGRLVELPCKVGDTVYKICPINKSIQMGEMRNGKIVKSDCQRCPYGNCGCANIGFITDADNVIREVTAYDMDWIWHRKKYFGEIYFLSKEEAEQALAERQG